MPELNQAIFEITNKATHGCDGPLTRFVVLKRIMDQVSKGADATAATNAFCELYPDPDWDTVTSESGS